MEQKLKGRTAILIVAYNAVDSLRACLDSLDWVVGREEMKLYLADNSQSDQIATMMREEYSWVEFTINDQNLGFGSAVNQLYSKAISDFNPSYILLVNPDLKINENAIDHLIAEIESDKMIGVVAPRLISDDGFVEDSVLRKPHFHTLALKFLFEAVGMKSISLNYSLSERSYVQAVSGACMLIREEVIGKVGLFNEDIFMYFEDLLFCNHVNQAGWKVVYLPEAVATHGRSRSSEELDDKKQWRAEQTYISLIHYFNSEGGRIERYMVRVLIISILYVRSLSSMDKVWAKSVINKIRGIK